MNETITSGQVLALKLEEELRARFDGALEVEAIKELPDEWKPFPLIWICYREGEGCVNEDSPFWDYEDINASIWEKFYWLYKIPIDRITEKYLGTKPVNLETIIDSTYSDRTRLIVIQANKVLFRTSCKAWNLYFNSTEDLFNELEQCYNELEKSINGGE
jgi:hypothetical protein